MSGDRPVVLIETRGDTPAGHFGSTLVTLLISDPDGVQCVIPNGLDPRYLRPSVATTGLRTVTSWSGRMLHWTGLGVRIVARRLLGAPLVRRSKAARSLMHAAVHISYALDEAAALRQAVFMSPGCVPVVMTAEPGLARFVETLSQVGHLRYLHGVDGQSNSHVERFASFWNRGARSRIRSRVLVPHPALMTIAMDTESPSRVAYVPFAVAPTIMHPRSQVGGSIVADFRPSQVRVLVIGHLWEHKQCGDTVDGIRTAFADRAVLITLAGEHRLRDQAESRGVSVAPLDAECLTEDELDRQIEEADVVVVERQRGVRRESGSVIRCLGASTPIVLITDDPFLHAEFDAVRGVYPVAPGAGPDLAAVLRAAVCTASSQQDRCPARYRASQRLETFRRSI